MKKLLTKFTSIFLAVVVLMSCCCFPVSADETTTTDELLTSFGSVPLDRKSNFLTDDGYVYKYCFLVRLKGDYKLYMFGKKNYDSSIDDISYLNLSSNNTYFLNSDDSSVNLSYSYLSFNFDSTFNVSNTYGSKSSLNTGYYYSYGGSTVENFVDNIIYSDFPVKYNGLTVYDTSKNKNFTIEDFISLGTATPDDPNFVGPLPIDIDGDGVAPYNYFLSPVEGTATYDGFINWLIENEKYKDLSSFGLSCTADNLRAVVKFWSGNYNNVSGFLKALNSMWSTINAVSQARNIYNWLQQQWELYKKSLITYEVLQGTPDSVLDTSVDYDDDGNFISSDTAYLKLILGTLFSFFNNFNTFVDNSYNFLSSINNNIYQIVNYIGNVPKLTADYIYNNFVNSTNSIINSINCIPNTIYNNFVDPINQILDAINNIEIDNSSSSSTTTNNNIDVNIDIDNIDNTTNNFNIAFGDLQLALENKFSFYNQLTEITNTVQNYTYTDTAPELTLNIGSEIGLTDAEYKIDFSFYEPYREMIRKIIIAVAYLSFAISLLNKLPNIIGGI